MVNFNKLMKTAKDLAGKHNEKLDGAIDKSVAAVDKATKGKYQDKIADGAEKLKGAVDKVADKDPKASGDRATAAPRDPAAPPADVPVVDPDAPTVDGRER